MDQPVRQRGEELFGCRAVRCDRPASDAPAARLTYLDRAVEARRLGSLPLPRLLTGDTGLRGEAGPLGELTRKVDGRSGHHLSGNPEAAPDLVTPDGEV